VFIILAEQADYAKAKGEREKAWRVERGGWRVAGDYAQAIRKKAKGKMEPAITPRQKEKGKSVAGGGWRGPGGLRRGRHFKRALRVS
jgi:hypothetical protein